MFSVRHDFWNSGFFHIPNYVLSFSMNSRQPLMCLHPSMNKQPLFSFRSLKIHHVLAFWRFLPQYQSWSQVCLSLPLMHTWLIEIEVFSCPCQLVPIERVEEKQPSHFHYSAYYYSLLILACHYSQLHLFPLQPRECIRVSYFLVTVSIPYFVLCFWPKSLLDTTV